MLLCDRFDGLAQIVYLALGGFKVNGLSEYAELVVKAGFGALQQHFELFGAVFPYEFVGVLTLADGEYLDVDRKLAEKAVGLFDGLLAGAVGVVGDDYPFGVAGHDARLLGRYGGAEGGHGFGEARLVHGDDVHVSLG